MAACASGGSSNALVCEVSDRGQVDSALVDRLRPNADPQGSRGLWIVNHLCDLVQLRSGAERYHRAAAHGGRLTATAQPVAPSSVSSSSTPSVRAVGDVGTASLAGWVRST